MKRFLSAGEGCAPTGTPDSTLNLLFIKHFSASIIFISLFLILSVAKAMDSSAVTRDGVKLAQDTLAHDIIEPLQIGDTIPEAFWHVPLEVVNHPEDLETTSLAEFREKLIILEFWSTWCGSCIKSLQNGDRLLRGLSDIAIIPVSYQPKEIIESAYRENIQFANLELLSVVGDTILRDLFPHRIIPHLVWIDSKGVIVAITSSLQLTAGTLNEFRNNNIQNWPVKYEQYDMNSLVASNDSKEAENKSYFSLWERFVPGKPFSHSRSLYDSLENRYTVQFANHSVYELIIKSLHRFLSPIPKNRMIGPQDLIDRFVFPDNGTIGRDSWYADNALSYEISAVIPVSVTNLRERNVLIMNYLREDISRFLGISFRIEMRTMPVLLIKESTVKPKDIDAKSYSEQGEALSLPRILEKVNKVSKDILLYEGESDRRFVFDPLEMKDTKRFMKKLMEYGFIIERTEKDVEVLIINENY